MIYNPRLATVPEGEFDQLMTIVRDQAAPRPLSDDDRWRAEYADEQRRRRIVGYQQDLFTSAATIHYRRNPAAPVVEHMPVETVPAKLDRIKDDPMAAFGPARSDRPSILTLRQRRTIVEGAANWLTVRQRVTLADAPGSVDSAFGIQRYLGRHGVIWRRCGSTFADHCYVFFDAVGAERTAKIHMVEVRDLRPLT